MTRGGTMTATRTLVAVLLLLMGSAVAHAQTDRQDALPLPASPTITVSTAAKGVRIVAVGSVKQMRIEVYGPGGDPVYSSGYKPGNVRDWLLSDEHGQRLPDGSYVCVVTAIDLSGTPSVKQGIILLQGGRASVQLREADQARPRESEKDLAPSTNVDEVALTVTAHDGNDGQIISTQGGLSFRSGNFFSGRDKELMRLTPDGNLGLGVPSPRAKLDVAGVIRARGGIQFEEIGRAHV